MKQLLSITIYAICILLTCVILFGYTNDRDVLDEIFQEQAELVLKYSKLSYKNLNAGNIKIALAYGDSCNMAYYAEHIVYMKMYPNAR